MIRFFLVTCLFSLSILQGSFAYSNINNFTAPSTADDVIDNNGRKSQMARAKVPWVKNSGQWEADILYVAPTFSGNVIVNKRKEILYALPVDSTSGYVLKERFVGETKRLAPTIPYGEQSNPALFNYFIGNDPSSWKTNVPSYGVLNLGEIWEGIEVKLNAYNNNVEKLFHVKPNVSPSSIQIVVEGAEGLKVAQNGQLTVLTPAGQLSYSTPVAYQWIHGQKHTVKVEYLLNKTTKNTYSFSVEAYDPNYELIIDPLLASTFIGDGGNDWGNAIAVDEAGHVFITGYTWSDNFPSTAGTYSEGFNGVKEAYVSKFSNDLSTLLASTFLGGSSWENGLSIIVEAGGEVIISGATGSANFPIAGTAYDNTYNGGSNDVFVCKLSNDLSTLVVSTFIGGGDDDYGYDLALDQVGNIFVTGRTESTDYPTPGGFDVTFNGGFEDVFVSKLNNDLSALLASTFIGGSTDEGADAIATDLAGNVFIAGFTYSNDFPTAGVPIDSTHNGSGDIFVAKFNNSLSILNSATFIGGSNFEESHAIAIDAAQNLFIAGYTGSPEYPATESVFDTTFNGNHDAVITKINNDLSKILASTFLGGAEDDDCYGLVIERAESVFITGISFSTDYPIAGNATDATHNGERDIFVSRLSFDLSTLVESTYLGGIDNDWALDLTIDNSGSVFIGGGTYSEDFPMQGPSYDDSHNGREDAIIAKIVGCGVNDFCDPNTTFGSIFLDIEQDTVCIEGCNTTASPGPINEGGCFDFPNATVWYTFTPESDWPCIKIALNSEELPQPQIAIFQGQCPGSQGSLPFACKTGAAGALTLHMGVEEGTTYYIAVSDASGAEGYFDICIENSPEDALSLDVIPNDLQCFESKNGSIDLVVNNGTGFMDYDWNDNRFDGSPNAHTLSIGTFFVTVTDENNCVTQSDSIVISQPDELFVDLELDDEDHTILYGDTITATALPSASDDAIVAYWSPQHMLVGPTTNNSIEQNVSPIATSELIVTIENSAGCLASDSTLITVSTNFPYYVPNVFAPNSSHVQNAIFRPFVTNKVERINYMRVFNRWGAKVYERTDFPTGDDSTGWDGQFNGSLLNSGVYIYVFEIQFIDGSVRKYSGDVTLLR
ncbi:MAG: SBBP repeat-containing protein [Bacteroidota bacterium]